MFTYCDLFHRLGVLEVWCWDKQHPLFCFTFFFLAVSAHVGVVAVERSRCSVGTTAVILGIQRVDGDVDQMEDHFAAVHVSVRVL